MVNSTWLYFTEGKKIEIVHSWCLLSFISIQVDDTLEEKNI